MMFRTKKAWKLYQVKGIYIWKYYFLAFHWLTFQLISDMLSFERNNHVFWEHTEEGHTVAIMLEYFLQHCSKDCNKNPLQRVDLLHIELELRGLNY
jgi:hypothetical protein